MRVLAVCPVDHPGGAEVGLLRLLRRRPTWDVTLATPHRGALYETARGRGHCSRSPRRAGSPPATT
jgi:hypothetical protein